LNIVTQEFHTLEDEGKMKMGRPSDVADVVLRICSDRSIIGRAVSINAGATFDLGDDPEGGEGYLALAERQKVWRRTLEQRQEKTTQSETTQSETTQPETTQSETTQTETETK
jgi:hypothetical protein